MSQIALRVATAVHTTQRAGAAARVALLVASFAGGMLFGEAALAVAGVA